MKSTNNLNQLDQIIQFIEKREKISKRNTLLLASMIGIILFFTVTAYVNLSHLNRVPFPRYTMAELEPQAAETILQKMPDGFLLTDNLTGLSDTIRSLNEYHAFVGSIIEINSIVEEDAEKILSTLDTDLPTIQANPSYTHQTGEVSSIFLDIEGIRRKGSSLSFRIEGYDPKMTYQIDYGNGNKRKVKQRFYYTYPSTGTYTLTLTAMEANQQISSYKKPLQIRNQPEETPTASKQAEESTEKLTQSLLTTAEGNLPSAPKKIDSIFRESLSETDISNKPESNPTNNKRAINSFEEPISTQEEDASSKESQESTMPITSPISLALAEKQPGFPGGFKALGKFFRKKINYPDLAVKHEIKGKVFVQFLVDANGHLSEFKLLKRLGYGCDEEALRVIKNMPPWIPGEQNGKKVPVVCTLPIEFTF